MTSRIPNRSETTYSLDDRVTDDERLCGEYEVRRDRRCQAYTVSKEAGYFNRYRGRYRQPKPQYCPQHSWVSAFDFEVTQQAIEATSCEAWLGVLLALLVSP